MAPRCPSCGKVNREGALFCQDCGTHLAPANPTPTPVPRAAAPPTCPNCGTVNAAGMNFCKMCGAALVPTAGARPTPHGGKITCTACGSDNAVGLSFCQQCGQRLRGTPAIGVSAGLPSPASVAPQTSTLGGMPAVAVAPTAPAPSNPRRDPTGPSRPGAGAPGLALRSPTPAGQSAVGGLSGTLPAPTASADAAFGATMMGSLSDLSTPAAHPVRPVGTSRPSAQLVLVRPDGSEGQRFAVVEGDIGRSEGNIRFDDPFLAPRHARLEKRDGRYVVTPLDATNGVFVRLREGVALEDGDRILTGQQLFRFEMLTPEERVQECAVEHGVRLFGTPLASVWGRLRQVTTRGVAHDIYYLSRPQIVLGRGEGDFLFPDDNFMSRRHAVIMWDGDAARLDDLGSSNGTYLRLRGPTPLAVGDHIRVGDQVLRLEAP